MARQTPRPRKAKDNGSLNKPYDRFCAGEGSWLARKGTSDPSTSEIRDGNGKPRHNKHKRQSKEGSPNNITVNARFRGSQQKKPFKGSKEGPSGLNRVLDRLCQIHGTPEKPVNHTVGVKTGGSQIGGPELCV